MTGTLERLARDLAGTAEPRRRRDLLRAFGLEEIDLEELARVGHRRMLAEPEGAERIAAAAWLAARARRSERAGHVAARVLAAIHTNVGKPLKAYRRLAGIPWTGKAAHDVQLARATAQALHMLGRFAEARRVIGRARRALPRRKAGKDRALLDLVEGTVLSAQGEAARALACFERGRRTLARLGERAHMAAIDGNRATALTNLEAYARAERLFARSRRAFEQQGQRLFALQSGYNHAYLRFLRGHYHDALHRFRELRPRFAALDDRRHVALCDLDEAEISLHMNLPARAAEVAGRAAAVLRELGLSAEFARAEFLGAVAARGRGENDRARQGLEQAETTFRALGNHMWLGICLQRLAEIDVEQDADDRAAQRAAEAARHLRDCGLHERAGYARVLAARIDLRNGDLDRAERRLREERAAIDASRLSLPWLRCELHHALARLHELRGESGRAARHVLRATRLLERHRVAVPPDEYMAAFLTGKAALFRDAVRIVLALDTPAARRRAFELAEQARGRALLDLLRHRRPDHASGQGSALEREARTIEREIESLAARMPALDPTAPPVDAKRRAREAARREVRLQACLDRLSRQDPERARLRRGAPPRVREVLEGLPADVTLLEYFLAGEELIAFLLAGGRLHVHRQPLGAEALRDLLERTSFQLDRPNLFDQIEPAFLPGLARSAAAVLGELHDLLLAPLRERITTRRLVVVPHGDLNGVPFHALEARGRPLLLDHEVVLAPSASIYLHCRAGRSAGRRSSLLLGVPDEAAPQIEAELETLARIIPNSRRLVGAEATTQALLRYGGRARFLHVAAHARFPADDPMEAGIRLADGWLTIPRIADMRLRPDLLVLAGCGTGRVSVTESGDLFGLLRGFLQAGAASLLASLWTVPDAVTAQFMERFYGALLEGASPAAAQRTAALAVRAEPAQAHPFYWAPFAMMGWGG